MHSPIKPKKIGIDLDSTLNRLDVAWEAWIKATHDPDFSIDKWLSWGLHEHTTAGAKVYDYLDIPGMFDTLDVQPEAVRVTQRLAEAHQLYIITAFRPDTCPAKANWVHRHFPHIVPDLSYPNNLIFCNKKHLVKVDIHIDDGAHNFADFDCIPLLFDAPWNRTSQIPNRLNGWLEIEKWMEENGYLSAPGPA